MSKSNRLLKVIQAKTDLLFRQTLLPLTPKWLTPNIISLLRVALIPAILICLAGRRYVLCLLFFIIAALLDAYDGALARYRQQFSKLGLVLDPLADKLLVIGALGVLLAAYPFSFLLTVIILLELILMIISAVKIKTGASVKSSNIFGKSKMIFQTLGIILSLIWLIYPTDLLLYSSAGVLWLSLILQSISILTYLF